jgi:hypothetical protein
MALLTIDEAAALPRVPKSWLYERSCFDTRCTINLEAQHAKQVTWRH